MVQIIELSTEMQAVLEKRETLKEELHRDSLAVDLRISLFVGAAQSFKYESLLKPVPAMYKKSDGEVDIEKIRQLVLKVPEVPFIDIENLDIELLGFLKTMLLNYNQRLSTISAEELKKCVSGQINLQFAPRWIFEVKHLQPNQTWETNISTYSSFYAFHGSRFENFHSILNLGLHQHLNKTSLFGEGIYLSTEQSVSLHYSTCGQGWSKSQLGPELSLLAICEVIDHPNVKKRGSGTSTDAHSVPEKYILVTNNELVRPRYLLVYTRPKTTSTKVSSFIGRHKFILFLGLYASLLLAIGLAKKLKI